MKNENTEKDFSELNKIKFDDFLKQIEAREVDEEQDVIIERVDSPALPEESSTDEEDIQPLHKVLSKNKKDKFFKDKQQHKKNDVLVINIKNGNSK